MAPIVEIAGLSKRFAWYGQPKRNEINEISLPDHSMTSSARASSVGGIPDRASSPWSGSRRDRIESAALLGSRPASRRAESRRQCRQSGEIRGIRPQMFRDVRKGNQLPEALSLEPNKFCLTSWEKFDVHMTSHAHLKRERPRRFSSQERAFRQWAAPTSDYSPSGRSKRPRRSVASPLSTVSIA